MDQKSNSEPPESRPEARRVRERRTQADRTEETRRRTLDAAIACLWRDGYAATSTLSVAAEARLTRSAILHHFPTKTDLILAVAEEVVRRSSAKQREIILREPRGLARFAALTEASWTVQQQPEAMTLLEILMASRGDRDLAERLPSVVQALEAFQLEGVLEISHDLGVHDDASIEAMTILHKAAQRGLAIELLFAEDRTKIDAAFDLLRWYKKMFTERILAESAPDDTPQT